MVGRNTIVQKMVSMITNDGQITERISSISHESNTSATCPETSTSSSIWSKFESLIEISVAKQSDGELSAEQQMEKELTQYFNEPVLPIKSCPFQWWGINASRFPHVASVARIYLAIPATSVPSERIFSSTGLIISDRRNRLKPSHVEQLIFINKNT
jgi:hypothetical protein